MLVTEAITEIRNKINDRDMVGLDDAELLSYLNEAMQLISVYMVGMDSPDLIEEQVIEEETFTIPKNFDKFCGYYPIKRTGTTAQLLDEPPLRVRYFISYPIVDMEEESEMPFNHAILNQLAIKIACTYAQNQEHEEISQDKAIIAEIQQAIAVAMGVGA